MKINFFLAGVISLLMLFLAGSVCAQVSDRSFASETITVTGAEVKSLTAGTYTVDAKKAQLTFEGADVRYTLDGSNPNSTTGHLLQPNISPNAVILWLGPYELRGFRVISTSASWNATVRATYYKN
jgi:hypothetical protein